MPGIIKTLLSLIPEVAFLCFQKQNNTPALPTERRKSNFPSNAFKDMGIQRRKKKTPGYFGVIRQKKETLTKGCRSSILMKKAKQ